MNMRIQIASEPKAKRPQTPMTTIVSISSFVLGFGFIFAAIVRGLLVLIGTYGGEHYSGVLAFAGLLLIGLGAHCLDLMEKNERNLRG